MIVKESIDNQFDENYGNIVDYLLPEFKERTKDIEKIETYLSDKKFKLGQVVWVTGRGNMFSRDSYGYGIIVGHGLTEGHDGDYYRIFFDNKTSFSGVNEDIIVPLKDDEDIPDELKEYTWYWRIGKTEFEVVTINTFK